MTSNSGESMLIGAFNHLESAINLLDQAAAPGHIAAHADLALQQLADLLKGIDPMKLRLLRASEGCGTVQPS